MNSWSEKEKGVYVQQPVILQALSKIFKSSFLSHLYPLQNKIIKNNNMCAGLFEMYSWFTMVLSMFILLEASQNPFYFPKCFLLRKSHHADGMSSSSEEKLIMFSVHK